MIAIRDFTRSSSFRVGALLTTLAFIAIALVVYFWRLANSDVFISQSQTTVHTNVKALSLLYKELGIEGVIAAINSDDFSTDISDSPATMPLSTFIALSKGDKVVAGNIATIPTITERFKTASVDLVEVRLRPLDSTQTLILPQALMQEVALGDHHLYVGQNIEDVYAAQRFSKALSWIVIVLLSVLSAVSFAVAVYVVNRINRMSETADKIIKTGSLQTRLEIDSNWDDLSSLAIVFNHMLETIENSVNSIKSVTDSIAHDLRTPLSRLRNTLEKIDDKELREETTQEADNLLNMFNSLLRISGLETTNKKEGFRNTDITALVNDVVELYQPLAEERGITLSSALQPLMMNADPNLLFQAVANVLDNAIKYSPDNSAVVVALTATKQRIVIAVNDAGMGVGEHELANLERRFYRADGSRSTKGNGLGLSLVSAIVKLHEGTLWYVHDPLLRGKGLGVVFSFAQSSRA
ncbi:hypothetical protein D210916BOD24_24350 [Alteromonas sp. D210916BOD_24]|uniref:sensor histidine kinase n=1 Tax=Alteromonas sp. D210916BOD_24 TaxID=3157618 RepID=UPI00399D4CA7